MKAFTKTILAITAAVALIAAVRSAHAQDEELAQTDRYQNFELSKMFSVQTPDVIGSKDIGIEGARGTEAYNAKIGVGLGDVAEVNTSVSQIMSNIKYGYSHMTSSLKVRLLRNNGLVPSVAVMVSKSLPATYDGDLPDSTSYAYEVRYTDFYGLLKHGTVKFGLPMAINYGFRLSDSRIVNKMDKSDVHEKMLILPFAGLKIQTNDVVTTMLEAELAPYYDFGSEQEGTLGKSVRVSREVIVHGGVRFFVTTWLAFNAGAKYTINPNDTDGLESGLANTELLAKVNMNIPTSLLFKRISHQVKD